MKNMSLIPRILQSEFPEIRLFMDPVEFGYEPARPRQNAQNERNITPRWIQPFSYLGDATGMQVKCDDNQFQINMDVRNYEPEELRIQLSGDRLTISGKHEEREDRHGFISRQFQRSIVVPEAVNLDSLKSTQTEDGRLVITAALKSVEAPKDRTIAIERTPAAQ